MMEGPGAESEEKREPASDIETAAVDSLKCLTQIGRLEKQTFEGTGTFGISDRLRARRDW
jgi:hypothetical protein